MIERLIAIGDIHGCAKTLAILLEEVAPRRTDTIVTLGDYINRGPDSKGVIDQLIRLAGRCTLVPLLGNHDEMVLNVLEGVRLESFLRFGGQHTLDSYGIDHPRDIPVEHMRFLMGCRIRHVTVNHFFVHAGYEPHLPLSEQSWGTSIWASLPEKPERHISGKTAVVGHTAQMSGEMLDLGFLKCIDTSCGFGGRLTALDVRSGQIWQVQEQG